MSPSLPDPRTLLEPPDELARYDAARAQYAQLGDLHPALAWELAQTVRLESEYPNRWVAFVDHDKEGVLERKVLANSDTSAGLEEAITDLQLPEDVRIQVVFCATPDTPLIPGLLGLPSAKR